jgi:uncharacterized protein (TIGR03067 family)
MKRLLAPLGLALVLAWPSRAADDSRPGQTEFKLLDGTWRIISSEKDGVEQPPAELPERWRLTFRAGDFERGDGPRGSIARINSKASPKQIDYRLAGTAKDVLAIYILEGDVFIECTAPPGAERPKSFTSANGTGHTLVIYKRVKKKTD